MKLNDTAGRVKCHVNAEPRLANADYSNIIITLFQLVTCNRFLSMACVHLLCTGFFYPVP